MFDGLSFDTEENLLHSSGPKFGVYLPSILFNNFFKFNKT